MAAPLDPFKIANPLVEVIKERPGFGFEALAGRNLIGEITLHLLRSFNQFGERLGFARHAAAPLPVKAGARCLSATDARWFVVGDVGSLGVLRRGVELTIGHD